MKRQTAKPSKANDAGMQFFTPELYLRFNSPDDHQADRAEIEWDQAMDRYQEHLKKIYAKLPLAAQQLCETCLHDAELLKYEESAQPDFSSRTSAKSSTWSVAAALSFQLDDRLYCLFYLLWDHLREHSAPGDWPFSGEHRHLLYDEVDVASGSRGRFFHRILLSDGVVMEIPFVSVLFHSFPLPESSRRKVSRRSA